MVSTGWIRNRNYKSNTNKSLNIPVIMDGMDQVYFYSTINISQQGDPEYIKANETIPLSFK